MATTNSNDDVIITTLPETAKKERKPNPKLDKKSQKNLGQEWKRRCVGNEMASISGLQKIEMVWDLSKQKVYDQRLDISF